MKWLMAKTKKKQSATQPAAQGREDNDCSTAICDEILQICNVSRDVPAIEILKQQVRLISCFSPMEPGGKNRKSQGPSPEVILSFFNEFLPVAETISELTGEEYERNRSYLIEAIVVFVRILKCQLDSFQENKTAELRDEAVTALRQCAESAKKFVDIIPDEAFISGNVAKLASVCSPGGMQKRMLETALDTLLNVIPSACDIAFTTFQKIKATDDFYRAVDSIIGKLGRYSNVIGPEPRIGELVREYSSWMERIERKRGWVVKGIAWTLGMPGVGKGFIPNPDNNKQKRLEIAGKFDRKSEMHNPLLLAESNASCDELLGIARAHDDNAVLNGIGIGIRLARNGIPTQDELFECILALLSSFGDIRELPQNVRGECRNLHAKTIGRLSQILVDMLKENASTGVLRNLMEGGLKIARDYQVLLKASGLQLDTCERIESLLDSIVCHNSEDWDRFIRQSGIPDHFGLSSFSPDLFLKVVSLCERCQAELGPSRRLADMIREYAARHHTLETEECNRQHFENVKSINEAFSGDKGRKDGSLSAGKNILLKFEQAGTKCRRFARVFFMAFVVLVYGCAWWLVLHYWDTRSMRIVGYFVLALTAWTAISWIRRGIVQAKLVLGRMKALKLENADFAQRIQASEHNLQKMNELATKLGGE